MDMNQENIKAKLKETYETLCKEQNTSEILINQIVEKAGFKADQKNDIWSLFEVKSYADLFEKHLCGKITSDDKNNKKVSLENKEILTESIPQGKQKRVKKLLEILNTGLYEKEEAVRLGFLAAVSRESIFFLGAPGSAKSMIARRIVQAFNSDGNTGLKYFEYLMNQFSTPEDIFGNISLKALNGEGESKEKEEYKRITDGMLPQADIAFLDEIWKASPAIQNTLLTILNERKFHNGNTVENVPLKALFAASNELPAENEGLDALYDRLIMRLCVEYIKDEDSFFDMIDASHKVELEIKETDKSLLISNEEIQKWKQQIDTVKLSDAARSVITAIRRELALQNEAISSKENNVKELFMVSDRRWKKIVHILKTSAFLNDRAEVDLMDCQLIEYCIWNTDKQRQKVREIVEKCIGENGLEYNTAIEEIEEQINEFDEYVTEKFYTPVPTQYEMRDEIQAYKIVSPKQISSSSNITPYYLGPDAPKGWYYDQNKNQIEMYDSDCYFDFTSFKIKKNSASFKDGYTKTEYELEIECDGKPKKDEFVFGTEELLERRQEIADSDKYNCIHTVITDEIKKIDDFIEAHSTPYTENLFAHQDCYAVIMDSVIESKKALEDALVKLDKVRERYQ